jgi:pyridoxine kinase
MARVLAISSQVARGHVGLSAIVPALHALGHETIALPTILLSNHPGHPKAAGERIAPALLQRMLDTIEANGWLSEVDAVLTGYLPSPEHVDFAVAALDRVRSGKPDALVMVDAILGDWPKGLYIALDAAQAMRDRLVPRAGVLKGNAFEIGWLSGREVSNSDELADASRAMKWPSVIASSVAALGENALNNVLVTGGCLERSAGVTRRSGVPKGTGDLLSGLIAGYELRFREHSDHGVRGKALAAAVAKLDAVVAASDGHDELQLVEALPAIASDAAAEW